MHKVYGDAPPKSMHAASMHTGTQQGTGRCMRRTQACQKAVFVLPFLPSADLNLKAVSSMAREPGVLLCACFDCCLKLRAQMSIVCTAQTELAHQQASLAVKLEHLQALSRGILGDRVRVSTTTSHNVHMSPLASVSPRLPGDGSILLCSCWDCRTQIPSPIAKAAYAQTLSAQKQASLAAKLEHLQTTSRATFESTGRGPHARSTGVATAVASSNHSQGTKRQRPASDRAQGHAWPSDITRTASRTPHSPSVLTAYCELLSRSTQLTY